MRLQPLGLEENLVRSLARETVDLVLDRGAIARTHALDHAREHRRAVEARADDVVGALVRLRDPAAHLARVQRARSGKREDRLGPVAGLLHQP